MTVIANNGLVGGPMLVAAPTMSDLLGLVYGLGTLIGVDDCNRLPQVRAQCWLDVKDPGNSLLVAARIDEPCMLTLSLTAALSLSDEVTISVTNKYSCIAGMPPAPHDTLLAIPLTSLPADEITVRLVHVGITTPAAKMLVDLRRPLNVAADMTTRVNDVRAAVTAATNDAVTRVAPGQSFLLWSVGTSRWSDTSLGCPVQGHAYQPAEARGYVVFIRASDQPTLQMEYHVSGSNLAFCGRVPY